MKISISPKWEVSLQFNPTQKDLNTFQTKSIHVIVYGYPYFSNEDKWYTAEDAFAHYQTHNEQFMHEIDGIYSILIIDESSQTCKIITDRYGIYTLFYGFNESNNLIITDTLQEYANESREIEIETRSVIEYLNYGIKLGNKTHFHNVKKFEGASNYLIKNNLEIQNKRYWELLDVQDTTKMSDEKFLEVFNQHFKKACALENKISIPLTGGRDSRAILSTCLKHLDKFRSYTHGPKYHTDVKQAKSISKHFNLPHKHYKISNKFGKKLLRNAEGCAGIFDGHYSFLDYLHVKRSFEKESEKSNLFLTGILGNQLYRHHPIGNSLSDNLSKEETAKLIVERIPSVFFFRTNLLDFYNDLFKNFNKDSLNHLILNSVTEVLDETGLAKKTTDYTRHFLFKTYCSNSATNTLRFTGKYFKVFGAFFHKDLLKQFSFIDLKCMINADMHNYIISKNSKYLSELSYYNSGRMVKYAKLITNKITNRFFKTKLFKHPDLANYHFWLKNYHKQFLLNTLDYDKMVSAPLFNKNAFNEILKNYLKSKVNIENKKKLLLGFSIERLIINLLSFELWLKNLSKEKPVKFV